VIICAEFSPITLGYGFTLNGIGGLVGINRSMSVPALQDGLRRGAIGSLLFPVDPVPRARQIIADVGAIFPPTKDQFVVGPMIKIGWGADILTGTVAIVVQFPAVKIALLGRVEVQLPPSDEVAILVLRLDFAGIVDIPGKTVSFDGSLDGSRVAVFSISGDIAMRAAFGEKPDFALSAGGLYPGYAPPAGFPSLRRLSIALADSDNPRLRMESYFAITPATLQFGGHVEFYYGVDIAVIGLIEVDAAVGFDALIVFPCTFVAHFNVHVLLRRNHQPFPSPTGRRLALSDVELLAPAEPSKIIALWNNFHALAAKLNVREPDEPLYLLKAPTTAAAPNAVVRQPAGAPGTRRCRYLLRPAEQGFCRASGRRQAHHRIHAVQQRHPIYRHEREDPAVR